MWFSLIKKFWKEGLIIALVLGFGITIKLKNNTIGNLSTKITQLKQDLELSEANLTKCNAHIYSQNEKIDLAAKEAEDKLKQLDQLKEKLLHLDKSHKAEIKSIRNQKIPKTCEEVREYLNNNRGILKW